MCFEGSGGSLLIVLPSPPPPPQKKSPILFIAYYMPLNYTRGRTNIQYFENRNFFFLTKEGKLHKKELGASSHKSASTPIFLNNALELWVWAEIGSPGLGNRLSEFRQPVSSHVCFAVDVRYFDKMSSLGQYLNVMHNRLDAPWYCSFLIESSNN